ncbi:MAG: hypothetical protein WBA12_09605 [Catalinimonas sp.]
MATSLLPLLLILVAALTYLSAGGALLWALPNNDVPVIRLTHFLFIGNAVATLLLYTLLRSSSGTAWFSVASPSQALQLTLLIIALVLALFAVMSLAWFDREQIFPLFYIRSALAMSGVALLLVVFHVFSTQTSASPREAHFKEIKSHVGFNVPDTKLKATD